MRGRGISQKNVQNMIRVCLGVYGGEKLCQLNAYRYETGCRVLPKARWGSLI
jgi:hypothetical protein